MWRPRRSGRSCDTAKGQYPVIERYAFSKETSGRVLPVPDPDRPGRMPEMLKALRHTADRDLGDECLIVGCVLGPLTLASQLLGAEDALYMAIDEPERLESLIDFSAEVITRFGLAQIECGAHLPIVFDPFASPAVVPLPVFPRIRASPSEEGIRGVSHGGRRWRIGFILPVRRRASCPFTRRPGST